MIALASIKDVRVAEHSIDELKKDYPVLFEKLVDAIHLTRALNFKYHYMQCLLLEQDPGECQPKHVHDSVLKLYKQEVQKVIDDSDFPILKQMILKIGNTGLSKICLLVLGMKPESLVGVSSIR